jgi:hypothetical protein
MMTFDFVSAYSNSWIAAYYQFRVSADGTLGRPALAFVGDDNTGLHHPNADELGFVTGGTLRGKFGSSGNFVPGAADTGNLGISGTAWDEIYATGVYNNTTGNAANVYVTSAGRLLRSTSSRKYKADIRDWPAAEALPLVLGLRPVRFRSTCDADDPRRVHVGLIAEEVAALDQRFVLLGPDGPEGVAYDRLIVPLAAVAQAHDARLAALEARLAVLGAA